MALNDLEQHVYAYYIAGPANDLQVATRWYPYGELTMIYEDKFAVAVRKFGPKAKGSARAAATVFLDQLIENGSYTTTKNEFGGTMHQFQLDAFHKQLAAMQAGDPIVQKAQGGGPEFWTESFAALTTKPA